ncbi:hypothetical protein [Streptomyces griseorubiginosus]|uniref:hypothetical protein n=1 Tax=Streptomyces griseorubiginosus TaxID=67304 RepID=UPI003665921E
MDQSAGPVQRFHFAGLLEFWMLCVLMAMTGLSRAPGETARGVLLPTLAGRAGMPLTRVAGLFDGAARCAALTASAVGGLLIAVLGAENVLLVDAATLAVAVPLFAVGVRGLPEVQPLRPLEPASLRAYRRDLAEGSLRGGHATAPGLVPDDTWSPGASIRDGAPCCCPRTPAGSSTGQSNSAC